jgi:hypothetical protein
VRLAEEVVAEADKKTGGAKCIYYRARISYLYDDQVCCQLDNFMFAQGNIDIIKSFYENKKRIEPRNLMT